MDIIEFEKMRNMVDLYRNINDTIVDIYPNIYDCNFYDIEGYYNEMYDEVEFTDDDYSHLANRIITLRNLIKATEELDIYETKYA